MARLRLVNDAVIEFQGTPVRIVDADAVIDVYGGGTIPGVTVEHLDGPQAGRQQTLDPKGPGLKPHGTAKLRQERYDAMASQAREIMTELEEDPDMVSGFIAKMDAGKPCVQLRISEQGITRLHQRLGLSRAALEELLGG